MRGLLQLLAIFALMFTSQSCSKVGFDGKHVNATAAGCQGSSCPPGTGYNWYQGGFNICSKPCGGGSQTQVVECRDAQNVVVADSSCPEPKPAATRSCNVQACAGTYTWNVGVYGMCSKTCGGGNQSRPVLCQDQGGTTIADSNCPPPKPNTDQSCNTQICPAPSYTWQTTPGICSVQCGGGMQTDTVVCKKNDGTTVADSFCDAGSKPPTTHSCNPQACPHTYTYSWEPQPWTACSKTCGGGIQTRAVACKRDDAVYVSDTYCNAATKPPTQQACNAQTCPTSHQVTQSLFVTPALNSVDVIMIVDDSSSMKEDQTKLAQRMNNLVSDLDALKIDYQVCVTTTDTSYYKGSPIKWVGLGNVIMNKNSPNKNQVFLDTINSLGAEWSSDERGIYAVNLMLKDFSASGCMRADSTLATIMISDEDERSVGGNAALSSVQYKPLEAMDYPDNLIANIHAKFDTGAFIKPFLWNSIIVKPGDSACEAIQDAQSSPAFPGTKYAELTGKTGGHLGSICDTDYTSSLAFIKDRVVNSMPGMTLQCTPIGTPAVTFDKPVSTTVTLTGNQLKFSPVIPEGVTITAVYNCP